MKISKGNIDKVEVNIIVAMDEKGGIGKAGKLPWHIREDLRKLRDLTKDKLVILGRPTYESMTGYYDQSGRPMPARKYLVLTSQKYFQSVRKNTLAVDSIESALRRVAKLGEKEVFAIGGGQVFSQVLHLARRLYLTRVRGDFKCDAFFPDDSEFKKRISSQKSQENGLEFEFMILERE